MIGDSEIERELRQLIRDDLGLDILAITPILSGIGLHRFYRVRVLGPPGILVARVEAPEDPAARPAGAAPEPTLEPLRVCFEEAGLPVPKSYGHGRGIDLLEDLGDESLQRALASADEEQREALYEEACDLIPEIQKIDAPELPAFSRKLDDALFRFKAELFIEWSLPEALDRDPQPAEMEVVREAFNAIIERCAEAPQKLAHRDFQSANIFVRPKTAPGERLAIIDFQGAFLAPPEYDLVCLLRDSYFELSEYEVAKYLKRIRIALPETPSPEHLKERFDLLTLSRKGKDHARFLSVAKIRGDLSLLEYVPATVRYLKAAAKRLAPNDERFERFAELIDTLPERSPLAANPPCEP